MFWLKISFSSGMRRRWVQASTPCRRLEGVLPGAHAVTQVAPGRPERRAVQGPGERAQACRRRRSAGPRRAACWRRSRRRARRTPRRWRARGAAGAGCRRRLRRRRARSAAVRGPSTSRSEMAEVGGDVERRRQPEAGDHGRSSRRSDMPRSCSRRAPARQAAYAVVRVSRPRARAAAPTRRSGTARPSAARSRRRPGPRTAGAAGSAATAARGGPGSRRSRGARRAGSSTNSTRSRSGLVPEKTSPAAASCSR